MHGAQDSSSFILLHELSKVGPYSKLFIQIVWETSVTLLEQLRTFRVWLLSKLKMLPIIWADVDKKTGNVS